MIYDREYMQTDYERRQTAALTWTIVVVIAAFIAQSVVETFFNGGAFLRDYVVLSLDALRHGYVWTLLTTGGIHAGPYSGLLHLMGNVLSIYFIGREVLSLIGPRRFVLLFIASILVGSLTTSGVAAIAGLPGVALGVSGAAVALLTVFACFHPHRQISFLLMFLIPVTVKPKHLLLALLAIDVFCFVFLEIPGGSAMAVPPSSLLGGALAGWVYFRFLHQRTAAFSRARPSIELPAWLRKRRASGEQTPYRVNISAPADIRAEVDRILDKINSQGFGSLTDQERRALDDARDLLNKR